LTYGVIILWINVFVGYDLEIVRMIFDRRFGDSRRQIEKPQFGIPFDDPYYFQGIIEALVNGFVYNKKECNGGWEKRKM
jgi:hypothetical protein